MKQRELLTQELPDKVRPFAHEVQPLPPPLLHVAQLLSQAKSNILYKKIVRAKLPLHLSSSAL